MGALNTARRQVSEGYMINFKKVLSYFYFKKQLLKGSRNLFYTLSLWNLRPQSSNCLYMRDSLFAPKQAARFNCCFSSLCSLSTMLCERTDG